MASFLYVLRAKLYNFSLSSLQVYYTVFPTAEFKINIFSGVG
jgi:hypothetical protein